MRCSLTLSYNGTSFLGSQTQTETDNTILGRLEEALSNIGVKGKIVASGSTDKGVHATGQVCHIDLPEFWSDLDKLKRVLNKSLPYSVKVKKILKESNDFHARYDAKRRVYRYLIKEESSNPFEEDFITFEESVDFESIQKNIKLFVGKRDFANFIKSGSDVSSTKRVIYKAFAYKRKDLIVLNFEANGFLRSQIRLMVGALFQLNPNEIKEQLSCEKKRQIKPAKSNGLYLAKIKY